MRLALDPLRLLLISLAGWLNQRQQDAPDYLQEENRVLWEQLEGKRPRLNDDQRRRLAVKAKKLGGRISGTGRDRDASDLVVQKLDSSEGRMGPGAPPA